mmetsp:Transcript_22062/g.39562  ORF Transcript_22062/g.39562 Transcript_22062/m.39562 type:complete len:210 (+) Transcript_22062:530-1159(+)
MIYIPGDPGRLDTLGQRSIVRHEAKRGAALRAALEAGVQHARKGEDKLLRGIQARLFALPAFSVNADILLIRQDTSMAASAAFLSSLPLQLLTDVQSKSHHIGLLEDFHLQRANERQLYLLAALRFRETCWTWTDLETASVPWQPALQCLVDGNLTTLKANDRVHLHDATRLSILCHRSTGEGCKACENLEPGHGSWFQKRSLLPNRDV